VRYEHTQYGPLHLILLGPAAAMLITAVVVPLTPVRIVLLASGGVMLLLATSFRRLTVRDEADRLLVAFGPLPLFRKEIPYPEIKAAEPGRTTVFDGWGIHFVPGRGWTWNLWGCDCVVLHLSGGKVLRVGTDDADGLMTFLNARLAIPPRPVG
jgi:hypothetical protein